jgi:hypothetical protein
MALKSTKDFKISDSFMTNRLIRGPFAVAGRTCPRIMTEL